jgi:hypothetical protein
VIFKLPLTGSEPEYRASLQATCAQIIVSALVF